MHASKRPLKEVKVCCIGSSGAGKSCLMVRYVEEKFDYYSSPTVGSGYFSKTLRFKDYDLKLNIWDTAGQETFKSLTRHYYRGASIIIVVYDITDEVQFDETKTWVAEIKQCASEDVLLAIVGNKVDLDNDRVVPFEDGKNYAESIGAIFMETSAKTGYHVQLLFDEIIKNLPDSLTYVKNDDNKIKVSKSSDTVKKKSFCCM